MKEEDVSTSIHPTAFVLRINEVENQSEETDWMMSDRETPFDAKLYAADTIDEAVDFAVSDGARPENLFVFYCDIRKVSLKPVLTSSE